MPHYASLCHRRSCRICNSMLDGMLLNENLVSVCHFKPYKEHQADRKARSKLCQKKVFMFKHAIQLFSAFEWAITHQRNGDNEERTSFVTYSSLDDAVVAIFVMNGYIGGNHKCHFLLQKNMIWKNKSRLTTIRA